MIADELALVDTNVLVYAASPSAPQHQASRALLESEVPGLCATPQVFAEFYSIVTNRRRVTSPFTPVEAHTFITECSRWIRILPISSAVVARWADLAEHHRIIGPDVFDLQIVVTMLEHGVHRIYTFNRADFERYPEIQVLVP
jgi:predicted nucleic acid-binding protein